MKTFNLDGTDGYQCPICGTNEPKEAVLVPIGGTQDDSGNYEAAQVHTDCLYSALMIQQSPAGEYVGRRLIAGIARFPHKT